MERPIVSISGIRGVVGVSLTPPEIVSYAVAFAELSGAKRVVIGYDGRPSGRGIKELVAGTLALCGAEVVDIGLAPTPTVQLGVERFGAGGGISITASHNPAEWNGLKFIDGDGLFLDAEKNAEFLRIHRSGPQPFRRWDAVGSRRVEEGFSVEHIQAVLACPLADVAAIRRRAFRVVVDAVNAAGSVIVPELLRRLGCSVIPLYCDASGLFPHPPEPLPHNLAELGETVRTIGADVGVAVDPDADRLVLFDERGEPFGEEYTVTSVVDSVLAAVGEGGTKTVVVNLSTTRAVDDVARKHGAVVHRTPVGEINVVKRMLETGAVVGGEGSGGVIVPSIHPARDSLVGLLFVLHTLAVNGWTASAYRATLPSYAIRKSVLPLGSLSLDEVFARATQVFADGTVNHEDGLRLDSPRGWVHIRPSNTEPILRIIAEAETADEADRLVAEVSEAVASRPVKREI
ncbi:MAG: phosphoglucosamine mutase [Bacteroidota bacterium]|nr:phosphoglucosamine mutase [Bacteroidota bacterium]